MEIKTDMSLWKKENRPEYGYLVFSKEFPRFPKISHVSSVLNFNPKVWSCKISKFALVKVDL